MSDFLDEPDEVPYDREWVHAGMTHAEEAGRRVGLYIDTSTVALPAEPDEDGGPVMLVISYAVGDLAWDDRTLHPDKEADKKEIRGMEGDAELDEVQEFRRRLAEGGSAIDRLQGE